MYYIVSIACNVLVSIHNTQDREEEMDDYDTQQTVNTHTHTQNNNNIIRVLDFICAMGWGRIGWQHTQTTVPNSQVCK